MTECECKIVSAKIPDGVHAEGFSSSRIEFCPLHESAQELFYRLVLSHKEHRLMESCKTCQLIERAGGRNETTKQR